jgi:hypothetical protein
MKRRHYGKIVSALILGLLVWRCSDLSLPPIARDLPLKYSEARPIFNQRVIARYPVGMSEKVLIAALEDQGFKVSQSSMRSMAVLSRFNGCGASVWRIHWSTDASGRISKIGGIYGADCL